MPSDETYYERPGAREAWLHNATEAMTGWINEHGEGRKCPPVRVSVGWPSNRGLSERKRVIGQCWATSSAGDGIGQIFISPMLDDDIEVLATLLHELIHAWDDCENSHKGPFVKMARALDLQGKPTATHAGEELTERLQGLLERLGDYPHVALKPAAVASKKQSTRMLKLEAIHCCGYVVRTTRKWIEEGLPSCPHGEDLIEV